MTTESAWETEIEECGCQWVRLPLRTETLGNYSLTLLKLCPFEAEGQDLSDGEWSWAVEYAEEDGEQLADGFAHTLDAAKGAARKWMEAEVLSLLALVRR